jgi:hypothetical protein
MNIDAELDVWREQWQSETHVPLALRRKVERQTRFMKIGLLADILVTIVIGGGTIVWALRSPQSDIMLLAAVTWLFLAAAWTFTLTVNRGNWSPSVLDTAAFVELSARRCRGRLAAIRFGAILFLCNIVFCLGWVYHHSPEVRKPLLPWLFFSSLPIDIVWLGTLAFSIFLVWYRRRKRDELAYFQDLQGQIVQTSPGTSATQQAASWSPRNWLHGSARRLRRGKRNREA